MNIFEIIESVGSEDGTPVIFNDAGLQDAFLALEALFDEYGYSWNRMQGMGNRILPHKISLVMEEIPPNEVLINAISAKIDDFNNKVVSLTTSDQEQSQQIQDAESSIELSKTSYTAAVLRDDQNAISNIEQQVIDAGQVIRLAEMRKKAIADAQHIISRYMETVRTMWRNLDQRQREGTEAQARATLYEHINVFAEKVAEYKAVKDGLGIVPTITDDHVLQWITEELPLDV